jgi:hypothetical protein
MKGYERSHPDTDILLLEPDQRDAQMFTANTFGYRQRRLIAEHAYQRTRELLRSRRTVLSRQLARHGLSLDGAALGDEHRRLLAQAHGRGRGRRSALAVKRLEEVLADLEHALKAA